MFNALKYTEELEKVGFTHEQSQTSVRLFVDAMNDQFVTKADLREAVLMLDSKIEALNSKIDSNSQTLESMIREMEYKLTIKLGTMIAFSIGITATLVKLL